MGNSIIKPDEKFSLNIQTVFTEFQNNPSLSLLQSVSKLIAATDEEQEIVSTAISKWMRNLIYGEHGRGHHAARALTSDNPVDMLRHVGNMINRGYLKHVDATLADILTRHEMYAERFLMFCFLEWAKKQNPKTKIKISLPNKDGRTGFKDKYRDGVLYSEVLGNTHLYKKK